MVLQAMESTNSNKPVVKVPVGISARHIHLTQEDVEKLFGKGYQLTKKKELMGGQFASNEQCTIVGLKLRAIENVRILGPVRSKSQMGGKFKQLFHWHGISFLPWFFHRVHLEKLWYVCSINRVVPYSFYSQGIGQDHIQKINLFDYARY